MWHLPAQPGARDLGGLLTVQTLTFKTPYVLLHVTHHRRELVRVGVTAHPTAAWVWRQLIEATAWGRQPTYLIRDRDRVYGGDSAARAEAQGIQTRPTPFRAPKANAIAERVVRTLRNDCLDHVLVLNEQHLRLVLAEYTAYHNTVREVPECCGHRWGVERPRGPKCWA